MTCETLFDVFMTFQKGAFLRELLDQYEALPLMLDYFRFITVTSYRPLCNDFL
jgi:hypothetical protein